MNAQLIGAHDFGHRQRTRSARHLAMLDERRRVIVIERAVFGPRPPLHEVARRLGITAERVRQLESSAYARFGAGGDDPAIAAACRELSRLLDLGVTAERLERDGFPTYDPRVALLVHLAIHDRRIPRARTEQWAGATWHYARVPPSDLAAAASGPTLATRLRHELPERTADASQTTAILHHVLATATPDPNRHPRDRRHP